MAQSRAFLACVNLLIGEKPGGGHEGGYSDHSWDNGGKTNMGITIGVLAEWLGRPATESDVRNLSREVAVKIYEERYWDTIRGDNLPPAIAWIVFDAGVNCGVGASAQILQRAVGATADGKIGPRTIEAVNRHISKHGAAALIAELVAQRIMRHTRMDDWQHAGLGWTRRCASLPIQAVMLQEGLK